MARAAWWIPIFQMAWLVLQAVMEKQSGEMAQEGQPPQVVSYMMGQIAVLYCTVSDREDRIVTWRKLPNRSPLTIGTRTWVKDTRIHAEHVPNSSQWNLVIENVNITDAGTYECQVNARGEQYRNQVYLEITAIPGTGYPRIEISGRNYIKQGEDIHLQCNASMVDITVDNLEWLKDSRPLQAVMETHRFQISTKVSLSHQMTGSISSSLEIRHSRVNDSGLYVCRSTERSQLAGVKLEVQPDSVNSKRAENIQQYKGTSNGQPCLHSARAVLVSLISSLVFLHRTSSLR